MSGAYKFAMSALEVWVGFYQNLKYHQQQQWAGGYFCSPIQIWPLKILPSIHQTTNNIHMKSLLTLVVMLFSLSAFCQGQLQKEATGFISFASGRVMQLADAVPEDKFNWSPQSGVRSFADVFKHIISANYFFGSKLGGTLPADVKMETLDADLKTKKDITAALKQSYDFILESIKNTKDDALPAKVEYPFPGEFTNMSSVLIALSHSNEHLGQLIAYSRMNGIKPPWSE